MAWRTDRYLKKFYEVLEELGALVEKEWGMRPALTVRAERCLCISVDFNMKGFAHKGGRSYILERTGKGYRTPEHVAKAIFRELTFHRNTCKECGEGIMPLDFRESLLGRYGAKVLDPEFNPYGGAYPGYQLASGQLIPPDAVEHRLEPRRAKRVDKLLKDAVTKAKWDEDFLLRALHPAKPRVCRRKGV